MELTEDTVRYVAKLAGLALGDNETSQMKEELGEILNYVERMSNVITRGVVATSHVHGVVNAFRDDVVKPSLQLEDLTENAPDFASGGFRVPKII